MALTNLGAALREARRFEEAISAHQDAAGIYRETGDRRGEGNHEVGRCAEAMTLHEQTLADRERVLGPDHPETLASRSNVATAYHAAGRSTEARAFLERVLTDRERVLGPDHPDTLASRNNLAAYEAGRVTDAPSLRRWWRRLRRSS
jgi:tetratricopeptide (TPR) repeat protein